MVMLHLFRARWIPIGFLLATWWGFVEFPRPAAGQVDMPSLVDLVTELQVGTDADRRKAAYRIGRLGPDARMAQTALIAALQDPQHRVREAVIWALGQLGEQGTEAAPHVLKVGQTDVNLDNRAAAVSALGNIGPPARDAVPWLLSVARGGKGERGEQPYQTTKEVLPLVKNAVLRIEAIRSLGKIRTNNADALGFLNRMLRQGREEAATNGAGYFIAAAEALTLIGYDSPSFRTELQRARSLKEQGPVYQRMREAADKALKALSAEKQP